ncbi:hypothetical protein [Ancylobacter aquaticus]|uniref:hypothetical protein n=1 Tax=Ancylobacter aquaticus TaxID=100 RepID=UPI0010500290|nr:hypothetical protein [Ancylobacter aquaticus]
MVQLFEQGQVKAALSNQHTMPARATWISVPTDLGRGGQGPTVGAAGSSVPARRAHMKQKVESASPATIWPATLKLLKSRR